MTGMKQKAAQAGTWEELTTLLWDAARAGNVPAMRILRDEMRRDQPAEDPIEGDFIDELAKKREASASG
jgi:hypothetical protein